jgi:hypothetical protein
MKETVIYFNPELRGMWPSPLADQWTSHYPHLFDSDDLRITRRQPKYHFVEWLAAIHLFHRDGALSLVEKYVFATHPRKQALFEELLTDSQHAALDEIRAEFGVQPPDLLVFRPDLSSWWFAEVKGPGDRVRDAQRSSHEAIERRMNVPVEVITVSVRQTSSPNNRLPITPHQNA